MFFRYFLFIIFLILLQSCNKAEISKSDVVRIKTSKLNEAATYNTQLGLTYLKQGDRVRAKRKLFLALTEAPNSPSVNAALAYFMEKSGEIGEATKYYKKAIVLSSRSGAQLNNYGAFLCRHGQYREAENYFLKAVKDNTYEHTAGAYENAGLCVKEIPDLVAATKYFNKALVQDPSLNQSLYELVNIEMAQKHNKEALFYLQKYHNLSLSDKILLGMGIKLAKKEGNIALENYYNERLNTITKNS